MLASISFDANVDSSRSVSKIPRFRDVHRRRARFVSSGSFTGRAGFGILTLNSTVSSSEDSNDVDGAAAVAVEVVVVDGVAGAFGLSK